LRISFILMALAWLWRLFLVLRINTSSLCSSCIWNKCACVELRGSARVSCSHTSRERLDDSSLWSPSAQVAIPPGHQLPLPCVHMVGALLTAATWAGSHPTVPVLQHLVPAGAKCNCIMCRVSYRIFYPSHILI
jgi:hypothetical protein